MTQSVETRQAKFIRLAEQRVNVILDKIRLLGQLSNRSNYEYTGTQIETIFKAIQKDLNLVKTKFKEGPNGRKRFSLNFVKE